MDDKYTALCLTAVSLNNDFKRIELKTIDLVYEKYKAVCKFCTSSKSKSIHVDLKVEATTITASAAVQPCLLTKEDFGVLIAVFRLLGVCHDFLYGDKEDFPRVPPIYTCVMALAASDLSLGLLASSQNASKIRDHIVQLSSRSQSATHTQQRSIQPPLALSLNLELSMFHSLYWIKSSLKSNDIYMKTKGEKPHMSTFEEAEKIINFVFGDF